ncbi:MAG: MFS transporter [Meiothermus sp.]|uniref:MFS transporter n=1 Tax=Meiothermus sp. TaxID=1955249 RepID=UPI0025FB7F65|nr:MFS transporter [Meiothermus sp.]MCS7067207.1 MFS transporter [Meiothermus sp.]MCX7600641.1 MFS transporter [Meiothermus sp.]MDW8424724.1 MFS transporter [Meiothermus sp.]
MSATPRRPEHLPLARLAIYLTFFVCGFILAAWVSRIPAIKQNLGLNTGELGLVLLGGPVGLVLAMPLTGWLIAHWGSRPVVTLAALSNCLSLPLLALAPSGWTLALALFVFGFTNAAMDISMNAQAVEAEKRYARPIMSSFHALFSLGGLVGAALGGAAAAAAIAPLPFFTWMALASGLAMLWASRQLLEVRPAPTGPRFVWPRGVLLGLGLIVFCTGLGEGAVADWSAVFMKQEIGSSEAVAALAFSAFSVAMVVGRLTGDALTDRFGPVALARGGGLLAASGFVMTLLAARPEVALLGFVMVGLGYCTLFPLAFSAAGRVPGVQPGVALASVATLGYLGFLAGPPVIGLVAHSTSLRVSFALVAGLAVVIALLAGLLRPRAG